MPSVTEWMYYPPIFRFSMSYFFGSHCSHAVHIKTAFWSVFADTAPSCPYVFESQWFYNHKRRLVFSFQRQFTYMLDHSLVARVKKHFYRSRIQVARKVKSLNIAIVISKENLYCLSKILDSSILFCNLYSCKDKIYSQFDWTAHKSCISHIFTIICCFVYSQSNSLYYFDIFLILKLE